jgi:hypothetical protein
MNCEHPKPVESRTEDRRTYGERASMPEHVWVGRDAIGGLMVYPKLPEHRQAVEYMRVLSREEVEKLANGEGVAVQQYINSLVRQIEGQRRHIAELNKKLEWVDHK